MKTIKYLGGYRLNILAASLLLLLGLCSYYEMTLAINSPGYNPLPRVRTENQRGVIPESATTDIDVLLASAKTEGDIAHISSLIKVLLVASPPQAADSLRLRWIPKLLSMGYPRAAADLAIDGICAVPQFAQTCEELMRYRSRAFLQLGEPEHAFKAAIASWNVATLHGAIQSASLIAVCLEHLDRRDEATAIWRCVKGSGSDKDVEVVQSVVSRASVDDTLFSATIDANAGNFYGAALARGNLQLLSGHLDESIALMIHAKSVAPPEYKDAAVANIQRAYKGRDAVIMKAIFGGTASAK